MTSSREMEAELRRFRDGLAGPAANVSWQVRKLLDRMHADLFDCTLNVRTLRDRCRMRDNNVTSRFKHEVGVSMKGYLESLRLEAARRLLRSGLTASEAALAVGYGSVQTFYRAFERRYRCTPGVLRRHAAARAGAAE
jgi:AraC-like DNA-binding protein